MVQQKVRVSMNNTETPANAGKPWTEEDIMLIASYVPTRRNAGFLAELLQRTPHAIQYMWSKLYWPVKQLQEYASNDTKSGHYQKILTVRRKMKICIK